MLRVVDAAPAECKARGDPSVGCRRGCNADSDHVARNRRFAFKPTLDVFYAHTIVEDENLTLIFRSQFEIDIVIYDERSDRGRGP